MGLISTLKSILGLDDRDRTRGETNVTVEREPDATSERAVKESTDETTEETTDSTGTVPPEEGKAGEAEPTSDEPETGSESEGTKSEGESTEPEGESVEVIKGIGPAYAGRLEQVGVSTVEELAAADADELATETDISGTRIEGWIERAQARTE